jgi:hypothetical protein
MVLSEEVLMGFAGVAVALIGFSGVVMALGRRGHGQWSPPELLQLRTLVEPSIIVLFAAFVPSILALVTDDVELIWRTANGVLFIGNGLGVGAFLRRGSRGTILLSQKVMAVVALAIMVAMLLSSLGYFGLGPFTFALGLLHSVLASVHNFYLLLFPASKGGET